MNKKINAIANVMVVFALILGIVSTPAATAIAVTQFGFDTGFDPVFSGSAVTTTETTTQSGVVLTSQESTYTECVLEASKDIVTVGDSIVLSWYTSGFDSITVNGETVNSESGSMTIRNLQNSTIYTLQALSDSGAKCNQTVTVTCLPPAEEPKCELEVQKTVNKATALPEENLTYTITVKNTGTADCTGGGVKIEDALDPNIVYQSYQVSSNFSAGYAGTPVYTSGDRTLHFNGNVLTPGESGTITWVGKVKAPTQCGDFEVKNQAKATAAELNNFGTWTYSPTVKTLIDNDCPAPKPCDLELHKTVNKTSALVNDELTYTITIKNNGDETCSGSGVLIEDVLDPNITYLRQTHSSNNIGAGYLEKPVYTSADRTLHFNGYDLTPGESGTITWVGKVKAPTQCGDFEVKNQAKATAAELNNFQTWVYSEQVKTAIDNDCYVPQPPTCTLEPSAQTVGYAGSAVLTWTTQHATAVTLTDFGSVASNGTVTTAPLYTNKTYTLLVTGPGGQVTCTATVAVAPEPPAPTCDAFTATPSTIVVGDSTTLAWETSNADQVFMNNGVGAVAVDGSVVVSPLASIVYRLTLVGAENQTINCEVPVTVTDDPKPVCESFTATPSTLPYGGGSVLLDWRVTGAASASIAPTVGAVTLVDSKTVLVTQSTTFTLTAVDDNGDEVSCVASVAVGDPIPPLTCADNVSFTASDYAITKGDTTTLIWSTTDVDAVSISGINATALSGSQAVSPTIDTKYTLTATRGSESVSCPLTIAVSSGGGGGGSVSPRCELTISDSHITSGDEVVLRWDTSNATEVTLTDNRGKTLMTTADYLLSEKADYYDGKITVKPTRDTVYTLLAKRGTRDQECTVKVDVEDDIVVLQTRDQQPLVAGISLSQVPYTGFDAGPFMTAMFYLLLIAWAFFITYLLVLRNKAAGGTSVTEPHMTVTHNEMRMQQAETVRPDVFVKTTVVAPTYAGVTRTEDIAPANLPTGQVVVGYENVVDEPEVVPNPHQVNETLVTELENRAHEQKALLSSDAVRHFIGTTSGEVERHQALDGVIAEAKKTYPLEDGWIVINESRMRNLCEVCLNRSVASNTAPFTPATVPVGSGSLAEAIVTGNIVAAYEMIGSRPMFALADAAADLDALYRYRKDGNAKVSELLKLKTEDLSDEQIKNMITALTGALDGTYTDEASAVKMAIMKAVKEIA